MLRSRKMIDEWPPQLIDALIRPDRLFAAWIGSGLACELGYHDWKKIMSRLIARYKELEKPGADIAQIEQLVDENRLPAAAETAARVLGQEVFEQVISEVFDIGDEEQSGLRACEDLLFTPFRVFVTTNYNRSLSNVAARLVAQGRLDRIADVVHPGGSPAQLLERSIHYLHSDLHHISDIVMTDSSFGHAYGPAGPQRSVVATLANVFDILFIGTYVTDTDVRRVFQQLRDIFRRGSQTLRFALTPAHGQNVPTSDPLLESLGIQPIYYSTPEPRESLPIPEEELLSRHASMWRMISDLRRRTERYVKWAYPEQLVAAASPVVGP